MRNALQAVGLSLLYPLVSAHGAVSADFSHGYVGPSSADQNVGFLTLHFTVDAEGNVNLDASSSDLDPAAYVDGFDGPVGSIDDPSLAQTTFTVKVSGMGNLRIDNSGHGLSIQGGNAQRVDATGEAIVLTVESEGLLLDVSAVHYANSTGGIMDLNGVAFPIQSGSGSVLTSQLQPSAVLTIESASDLDSQGFVLSGLTFEPIRLVLQSMEIGTDLLQPQTVRMEGAAADIGFAGSGLDSLVLGGAGTILTIPSNEGTSTAAIGDAELVILEGARWFLDGSAYTGDFNPGKRFVLAEFGAFSGTLTGVGHRNFELPADRNLQLFQNDHSLYFEVVEQLPISGPNVIIIYMDDMSAGHHFGFEGRDVLTPTIDSLAAGGIVFTNAFAASSICSPSRYSLLTGRWPSRNSSPAFMQRFAQGTLARLDNLGSELPDDKDNIAGWLQSLGYRTGFVGKSHIIDHTLWNPANWTAGGLLSYPSNADPKEDAAVNAAMQFNHRVIAQRHQPRGFDFAGGVYLGNLKEQYNDFVNAHNQEWLTKYALQFIEENRSQRFFLYMAPTVNHGPIHSDLRYSLRANRHYTGEGYIANPDYSFMPLRKSIIDEVNAAGKDLESARETWLDYSIAAILAKLNEHQLLQDTLIIFTSDQGHLTLRDARPLSGKSSLYDSGIAVPLVMHWPAGIADPGTVFSNLVQNVDIAPTLLELAGLDDLSQRGLDGVSLASILSGGNAPVRSEVYSEIGYARAIRTLDWKLISLRYPDAVLRQIDQGFLWPDHRTGASIHPRPYYISNTGLADGPSRSYPHYFEDNQLYALRRDPREQNNLLGVEPAVWVDLKQRLSRYAGNIPSRAFGEFAPAAQFLPSAPKDLEASFPSPDQVKLNWTNTANAPLGFFLQQSLAGGNPSTILELPTDSNDLLITLPEGVEDIRFELFAYNAVGVAPAEGLDLIEPDHWRQRVFANSDPELLLASSGWEGDPDQDGMNNLIEYAFGLNPLQVDAVAWPILQLNTIDSVSYPEALIPVDGRRMVDITPLWSTDMVHWSEGESALIPAEGAGPVRVLSHHAIDAIGQQFFRIIFNVRQ